VEQQEATLAFGTFPMVARGLSSCYCTWWPTFLCLLVAAQFPNHCEGLALFFRTSWAHEVSDEVFNSWFELIGRGRAEGPSSPYYVEFLALQSVACSQAMPLGPPCNASAPSGSHQPLGNESMPYGGIFHADVAKLAKYFHLFDKVYIGSLWPDALSLGNASARTAAVAEQTKVMREFYATYGSQLGDKLGWYQTVEGSLNEISSSSSSAADWLAFHNQAMAAFHAIKPAPQLWSPNWERKFGSYNKTALAAMEASFETLFCGLDLPLALHYQDYLGQSVTFEFPFHYNYSAAFTCEGDSVPYYQMLRRVQAKCSKLREVKVNMEMFAERLNNGHRSVLIVHHFRVMREVERQGKGMQSAPRHAFQLITTVADYACSHDLVCSGENAGANIVNANPSEIASRMACYTKHKAPIGCSWALPHWYGLMTYANETVYAPY
jgi:hypothetical protein